MVLPIMYIIRAMNGPAIIPTVPPTRIVTAGTSTISTPVFPAIFLDASAPAHEATSAPTGSPMETAADPPAKEKVPAPIAPAIRDENIPRGEAPAAKATPAPMAGPMRNCATLPNSSTAGMERSCPHWRRISPMIRDEKRPSAIPLETFIR